MTAGALSTVGAVAIAASIGSNAALVSSTSGTGAATLLSQSNTSSSTPSVSVPRTTKPKRLVGIRFLDGFHATVTHWDPKTSATTTMTFDRGLLTAVSATSISIAEPNGATVTETIDATTKLRGTTVTALEADLAAHRKVLTILVQRNGSLSFVTTGAAIRHAEHGHLQSGATVLRRISGFQETLERFDRSTNTTVQFDLNRGELTTLNASSVSIKEPNGTVVQVPVLSTTRFIGASQATLESELSSSQTVHVVLIQKNGQLLSIRSPRHGVVVTSPNGTGANSQSSSTASA